MQTHQQSRTRGCPGESSRRKLHTQVMHYAGPSRRKLHAPAEHYAEREDTPEKRVGGSCTFQQYTKQNGEMSRKNKSTKAVRTCNALRRTRRCPRESNWRKLHAPVTHYAERENDKEYQVDESCTHQQRTTQITRMSKKIESTNVARSNAPRRIR